MNTFADTEICSNTAEVAFAFDLDSKQHRFTEHIQLIINYCTKRYFL